MDVEQEKVAYIALGANLGDRISSLRTAVQGLHVHDQVAVRRASPVYETAAHTLTSEEHQPEYLNAVVEVATTLEAEALLAYCHVLEAAAGRVRHRRWMPRRLDLDLILFGQEREHRPGLVIPHPRLALRRFVLQPLADLAPNLHVPPPFDASVSELLARCPDSHRLIRTSFQLSPEKPSV